MARINAGSNGEKPENGLPPLTAVDSRRGNELSEAELHSIRLINEEEQRILSENPGLAAPGTDAAVYYVCEDGRIFKIADNGYFYGFNFQDCIWEPDTAYMGMFMDQAAKFSMLRNFRDYYRTKSVKKSADDPLPDKGLQKKDGMGKDAYVNSIYGFVIGDALGVPVEFLPRETLRKNPVKGMTGFGSHQVPEGTWSDDTSMILAEMDSVTKRKTIDYNDMMDRFLSWIESAEYTGTGKVFDIGMITRKSLYQYADGTNPLECGGNGFYDNGNGSLMRTLPFSILLHAKGLSFAEEVAIINDVSSLTHRHEISRLGCKIYTDILKSVFEKQDKKDVLSRMKRDEYSKHYSNASLDLYKCIFDGSILDKKEEEINSGGFVVSTLEAAVWAFYHSNSFEEGVLKAVNLGKDTDTVAALAGALSGAYYNSVPGEWLDKIWNRKLLDEIISRFTLSVADISL